MRPFWLAFNQARLINEEQHKQLDAQAAFGTHVMDASDGLRMSCENFTFGHGDASMTLKLLSQSGAWPSILASHAFQFEPQRPHR